MKRGKIFSSGLMAVLLVCAFAFVVMAQQAPETISIKAALWANPTKGAVAFSHKKHSEEYKVACDQCHHVFKDGKNTWKQGDAVQKCDACHTEPTIEGEKKLPPDQQKLNLKLAFHNNCIGCHQKMKKDKPDTKAPVTCTGCHPAQK